MRNQPPRGLCTGQTAERARASFAHHLGRQRMPRRLGPAGMSGIRCGNVCN
jgi:hypothetical protein